eukprot:gene21771-28172_t
MQPSTTNTRNI